jgi:hypothetical protein
MNPTELWVLGMIRGLSYEEDALATRRDDALLLLRHVLPALPILLLGFVGLEGRELVRACVHTGEPARAHACCWNGPILECHGLCSSASGGHNGRSAFVTCMAYFRHFAGFVWSYCGWVGARVSGKDFGQLETWRHLT